MIFVLLIVLVLALSASATLSHRMSMTAAALFALAVTLAGSWFVLVFSLGALSAHYDSSTWPSPAALAFYFFVGYAIVAAVSVMRKTG